VVTVTLQDILEKKQDVHPPAVFVVGEVVRLREQINWFDSRSLSIKDFQTEVLSSSFEEEWS
jgi:hypothetical protein